MQDNHIRYNDIITEKLSWLVTTVNLDKKLNLMNRAVLAENFYVEFLSALTNWKLENANKKHQNEPGIDLVSNDPNIIMQVSVTNTSTKLQSSLDKIDVNKYKDYQFYFVIIGEKKPMGKYDKVNIPAGIRFTADQNIWDINDIRREASALGIDKLRKLAEILEKYYGDIINEKDINKSIEQLLQFNKLKRENLFEGKTIYEELLAPVEAEDNGKSYDNFILAAQDVTNEFKDTTPIILTAQGGQGKSTQLLQLWEKMEKHIDNEGNHDIIGLFCDLYQLEGHDDLVEEVLRLSGLPDEDRANILNDMKHTAQETHRHYVLLFDGQDEMNSAKVKGKIKNYVQEGNRKLVVVTGRNNSLNLDVNTNNMVLKSPSSENIQRWIEKYHSENVGDIDEIYKRSNGNPMLLILAYEIDYTLPSNDRTKYIEKSHDYLLRLGEVLWNYSEYTLRKYCNNPQLSKAEIKFARQFIYTILPSIAHIYYSKNDMKGISENKLKKELRKYMPNTCGSTEASIIDVEDAIQIIKQTFSGLFHIVGDRYIFNHRFFRDYYAMLHVSNLVKKLYDGDALSENDYLTITDIRFYENDEYYDLLLCTLPFAFNCYTNDYEQRFVEELNDIIDEASSNTEKYNSIDNQIFRFFRAMYPIWMVRSYLTNKVRIDSGEISDIAWNAYKYMLDFTEITKDPQIEKRLQDSSFSFVLYVLSQVYRTGSLGTKRKESKLNGFLPNVNKSFELAYTAISKYEKSADVIDGYNYIMKAFLEANTRILKHFYNNPRADFYQLNENDLIADFSDICIDNYCFSEHITEKVANAKPGDKLSLEEVYERIKCFSAIGKDFLKMGEYNNCVFSINILALAEELLQENKPKCERDFALALDKYISASKLDRAASLYSASKAAQLLTQKKAGINEKGEACFIEQANEEKTIATAVSMMELAALDRQYWRNNHYFKGELLTNYHHNGERYLNCQEANQAAFNEYNLAASMMKERNMPVIIGLIRSGIEVCEFIADNRVRDVIQSALQDYHTFALKKIITMAKGERVIDNWAPSFYIVTEYMDAIREIASEHKTKIHELGLSDEFEKCLKHIDNQDSLLQKWIEQEYPVHTYFNMLKTIS